ncbi:SDR family NAD(P)-dependent oxidoreductase [Paenibacillus piri]|uniref:SDR family oxidoreductase n=1 Tax=Paenibacillus piri TaxID=2547395 RepID=A0A4R5KGK8_9BACL|nr:SDR family oxidoreductase [Paenibacillus piri]TDF94162.1 SDR family oxidoreductase [Paenibacillus piri]
MSLAGKIALVTGSGTGIGKGIALELAKRGVKIGINYNSADSDADARDTMQRIKEIGGESLIVKADVTNRSEIDHMVQELSACFGGIDILVNNAALQLNYTLFQHDEDTYDREMNVNLKGYWQCMQAVIPFMKARQRGRIINICSVHGTRPTDFDTVYSMTKGGVKMLVRESAIELAKYGITVNSIEPGAIKVRRLDEPEKEEDRRHLIRKFPLGRTGRPHDIGHLICYIASDEAEFLSGASIRMDGASMLL